MKSSFATLAGLLVLLAAATQARAQYPAGQPTGVNPYLNMFRGGASPAVNYATQLQPQLGFQQQINQLQTQTGANRQAIKDLNAPLPPGTLVTGHQAGFMTQNGYFMTVNAGGRR